jgi:hypothetical protein
LTVEEELLRAARKIALDRNTSVNQLVRDFLEQLVSEQDRRKEASRRIEEFWRKSRAEVGPITWTREDLHDREG